MSGRRASTRRRPGRQPQSRRHEGSLTHARRQRSRWASTLERPKRCVPASETKSRPRSYQHARGPIMQPGGQPDMSALLAQAQQVQQKLMEAQELLANTEVHGQAGGGLVQVTMKGSGEVVGVSIDPKVVDPNDVETLQDLLVGAHADAARQVTLLAQERLGPLAGGMGDLGLPGV